MNLTEQDLVVVISEVNVVDLAERMVDTGATRHFYANKDLMFNFFPSKGDQLYMGNSSISKVLANGKIVLNLTFEKKLTLINVFLCILPS